MTVEQVPLQILTINGGGYQGIASLLMLDALIENVARGPEGKQGPNGKPIKPCDMFDVIGGVGSGGWLALLLGRFKLTISECLYEYLNIINAMTRRMTASGPSSSPIHRNIYDIDALILYVEYLTEEYGTGKMLLDNHSQASRCKHTFVVASCKEKDKQQSEFCVFRTYIPPVEYTTQLDPSKIRISHAFAAAGAKKGFLYPFHLPNAMGSTLNFGKEIIPEYFTNATLYALKEVRQQFGVDGVMPAIVNIGPGIPENAEKWEKMREMLHWSPSKNDSLVPTTKDVSANKDDPTTTSTTNPKHTSLVSKLLRHSSKEGKHVKRSWSGDIVEKIKTSKANTELQINNELKDFQSGSKYVRLVLDRGPKLTACTDLMASQEAKECTEEYLESDEAKSSMRQYWELIPPGRREAEVLPVN